MLYCKVKDKENLIPESGNCDNGFFQNSQTLYHVGIYPDEKCAFIYNIVTDEIICIYTSLEHPFFSDPITTIEGFPGMDKYHPEDTFELIKEKIQGGFGNVCVVLKYMKSGLEFGFKKVEFIDPYIGIYLHAAFYSTYIPKNNDLIWITEKSGYHVWEKIDGKANYIGFTKTDITKKKNLTKMLKTEKLPNAILFDSNKFIEFNDLFLHHEIAAFKFENDPIKFPDLFFKYFQFQCFFVKGALIHARLMENDPLLNDYAVIRTLNRYIEIELNDKVIKTIDKTQTLPFSYSIKLSKNGNKLKIVEYSYYADNGKVYDEPTEYNNILYTIKFDENKMLNVSYKPLLLSDNSEATENFIQEYYQNELLSNPNFTIQPYEINLNQQYFNPTNQNFIDLTKIDAVGIDYGTTKCCAAVYRRNGVESLALDNASRILPSYVSFDEENIKCGEVVVQRLRNHSKSTIFDAKRLLGKRLEELKIDKSWEFDFDNEQQKLQIIVDGFGGGKVQKYPEDVSASLLKHIKIKAEEFQGKLLSEAVITIPVAFNEAQKDAIFASALLAGWQKIHLLFEPTAAAIAYFRDKPIPNDSTLLLFDLGGGTLDVCILKISKNVMNIICENGDPNFGGRDFDNILVDFFENKMKEDFGIIVQNEKRHKLLLECQKLKHALSVDNEYRLIVLNLSIFSFDVSDFDIDNNEFIEITRQNFEDLSLELLTKIQDCINAALNKAQCSADQMDLVLYVGGGCRMPMIKKFLKDIFPQSQHCCEEHPDEVVAIGAAYYAFYLQAEEAKNRYKNKLTKFFYENFYYRNDKERMSFIFLFGFLPTAGIIILIEKVFNINTHILSL
uniref:Heat shock protein 70 n=1 Tax=Panagrolaimus sp. ES5 TaxID=591445 RepID=A0AC34F6E8_9BILA